MAKPPSHIRHAAALRLKLAKARVVAESGDGYETGEPETFRQYVDRVRPGYEWYPHCVTLAAVLQRVADGELDRVMVFEPPRHGKSELVSRLFPGYYLKRHPDRWVGLNSYGADLAYTLSRAARAFYVKAGGAVAQDSGAVKHWETGKGGGLWAAGVGGPITGKGFHLGIIDDPLKNAEEAASEVIRAKQKEWYGSTFYTREEPGGAIVVVQCMVGGTPVLMADGTEKPLQDVRAGDAIATYESGRISTSVVLKWANKGTDYVFTIRMTSGTTVHANERHPFLVQRDGGTEWVRLRSLKPGDKILRASIGASGSACPAPPRGVESRQESRGSATHTITSGDGAAALGRRQSTQRTGEKPTFGTDTELASTNTRLYESGRTANAPSAASHLGRTSAPTGAENSASITTTRPAKCGDCSATIVTSWSGTERRRAHSPAPLSTYGIILDEVSEVVPAGREEVFDIQVKGTENFIANGLVSHNTRWHEDDLSGHLIESEKSADDEPEGWHVVSMEAIKEAEPPVFPPSCTVEPDTRQPGEPLCPARYSLAKLKRIAKTVGSYIFAALFQQRPAPAGGGMFTSFPIVNAVPKGCKWVRYWDKAGTANGGAYTAGVKMALTPTGEFIITHIVRGQWSAGEREKIIKDTAHSDGKECHVWVEQEPGSGGKESAENTVKNLAGFHAFIERVTGDKETRARPMAAQAEIGNVKLLKADWNQGFVDEARAFPNGRYKDQIDAAGGAFNKLALALRPTKTEAAKAEPLPAVPRVSAPLPAGIPHPFGQGAGF